MRLLREVLPDASPVSITWNQAQAVFEAGAVRFIAARREEGSFPSYMAAIPKAYKTTFTLEREELLRLLSAFKLITKDHNVLRIAYQKSGSVAFSASSNELGEVSDVLSTTVSGEEGNCMFDAQMLETMLRAVQEKAFTFSLSGSITPCLVRPVGRDDYCYVLIPLSPNKQTG